MAASDGLANLPSGIVTLLLTDIEGSTRRWAKNADQMDSALQLHDRLITASVAANQGFDLLKRGEGDSHFCVFASAIHALHAALQVQRELRRQDWGAEGEIRVRIAIHTAEVQFRNNDYFGSGVNRCARMRAAAHGGQIILSESTKMLVAESLPPEVTLRDLGYHRFKDLAEPDRIYQVIANDLLDVKTPLASLSAAKHNLPVQLSSFVGREGQLKTVRDLLKSKRLIALLGAGGTGKTRLALQIGADVFEKYPDGVWFVPLAGLQNPDMIAQAIAESLPISIHGKTPLDAIIENYQAAQALFIVDNCEHLDKAPAEVINALIRACPSLVILATSREPLGVFGESAYRVPPMECDLRGRHASVDAVGTLEAVQLFRERARSRLSDEEILTEETAADIAAIVKKLDGIPLALEQAAACLSYMSPAEILDRLNKHFAMIERKELGIEDRHSTMEKTIDWSYSRLSKSEEHLFASLSIFLDGCTRNAAEFICEDEQLPPAEISPVLEKLVDRSLLLSERPQGWKITRYRMLEPIREFAAQKRTPKMEDALFEKRFAWFCNFCDQAYQAGLDADDGRYRKWLSADHDNIRATLEWALSRPKTDIRCLMLSIWMHRFWMRLGLMSEGRMWMQRSMDAAGHIPDDKRAEALNILGVLAWQSLDMDAAEKALTAAYDLYVSLNDRAGIAKASANLGGISFSKEDFVSATRQYEETVSIFRDLGDQPRLAAALESLGVSQCWLGDLDDSVANIREAIRIMRQLENRAALAKAIDSLLGTYTMRGELADHADLFLEGAELAIELDDDFLYENYLDTSSRFCIILDAMTLAGQALGAMDLAAERAKQIIVSKQIESREKVMETVRSGLGFQNYQRAMREGRSLGPSRMLGFARQCVAGE